MEDTQQFEKDVHSLLIQGCSSHPDQRYKSGHFATMITPLKEVRTCLKELIQSEKTSDHEKNIFQMVKAKIHNLHKFMNHAQWHQTVDSARIVDNRKAVPTAAALGESLLPNTHAIVFGSPSSYEGTACTDSTGSIIYMTSSNFAVPANITTSTEHAISASTSAQTRVVITSAGIIHSDNTGLNENITSNAPTTQGCRSLPETVLLANPTLNMVNLKAASTHIKPILGALKTVFHKDKALRSSKTSEGYHPLNYNDDNNSSYDPAYNTKQSVPQKSSSGRENDSLNSSSSSSDDDCSGFVEEIEGDIEDNVENAIEDYFRMLKILMKTKSRLFKAASRKLLGILKIIFKVATEIIKTILNLHLVQRRTIIPGPVVAEEEVYTHFVSLESYVSRMPDKHMFQ